MKCLLINIEGTPEPEPRGRATIARNKDGSVPPGAKPRIYPPATAKAWKTQVREEVLDEVKRLGPAWPTRFGYSGQCDAPHPLHPHPLPVPPPTSFAMGFVFRMARPKNHYGTGRNAGKLKPWAAELDHVSTPDLDNLIKAVKDCLGAWPKKTGVPFIWCDDSQVCEYLDRPTKRYVRPGEKPGLYLTIIQN